MGMVANFGIRTLAMPPASPMRVPTLTDDAPGNPGLLPTWASSAKDMVGTTLGPARLWFTIGYGILNEVFYPRVDLPQTRDLGFIVADGRGFWCEVKRLGTHRVDLAGPGIPAVEVTHIHPRFRLTQRIAPDARRDALLIEMRLDGDPDLLPYALLAPHVGGTGHGNVASVYSDRGHIVLAAEQGPFALALAASGKGQEDAWSAASAGYVGSSDGWQDFKRNGAMTWRYRRAGPGNVALIGQLPRQATLALAFGGSRESAATLALSALVQEFDAVWQDHVARWRDWQSSLQIKGLVPSRFEEKVRLSAMVLRTHQDKTYPGAMVASLSIPWGNARNDIGGYHLVWPRDLVESALALVAMGAIDDARDSLRYLIATQLPDGRWHQNQWLGGTPSWTNVQLDEVGWPVLLAAALAERDALKGINASEMVQRALGFVVRTGPGSEQDRWEEIDGIGTFTLAICIAALVTGATLLSGPEQELALAVADDWNANIEEWTSVAGSALAQRFGVQRYYVRCAPLRVLQDRGAFADRIALRNRGPGAEIVAQDQVSTDFLQLVRFGLRRADDPLVRDTLKVADGMLRIDTPSGPVWYRYNEDGYGEREGGLPYLGVGIGRGWPLLTGERGHYELAAGGNAEALLEAMGNMTGPGGLLPEQVWDRASLPMAFLHPGKPTGSAMPLAWAHGEFIKLAMSIVAGTPIDPPRAVARRFANGGGVPTYEHWTVRAQRRRLRRERGLRWLLEERSTIQWTADDWKTEADLETKLGAYDLHVAELPAHRLAGARSLRFRLRNLVTGKWDTTDYALAVG
jgi:glucoamylase